jgi:hypothetical protein
MQGPLMMITRFHIPYYGLPAFSYVHMLDPNILVASVAKPAKRLDVPRMRPHQPSSGGRKRYCPALRPSAASEPRQDRHGRRVGARHLDSNRRLDFVSGGNSLNHRECSVHREF